MQRHEQKRIVRALVQEIDTALQKCHRQSLREVAQDLTMRNVINPRPNDVQVLKGIYQTGVLRLSPFPETARLHAVLERFTRGTIGSCSRCGKPIDVRSLERDVSTHRCSACRHRTSTRKVPS